MAETYEGKGPPHTRLQLLFSLSADLSDKFAIVREVGRCRRSRATVSGWNRKRIEGDHRTG
jgi:hypothetical protein